MAIQDEMYKLIDKEIDLKLTNSDNRYLNSERAKEVARMLTSLSTDASEADNLVNQYIANIKIICNS